MERKVVMWIIIGVLIIAVVFMTLKTPSSGQLVSSAGQAVAQVAKPASSGMVGGC